MLESLQNLWPVMKGSEGVIAAILAWRGCFAVTVPVFNAKLKAWFTKLLAESPTVANSIVENKSYKSLALFLRMTIDIQLPNANSLIVHEVSKQKEVETQILNRLDVKK